MGTKQLKKNLQIDATEFKEHDMFTEQSYVFWEQTPVGDVVSVYYVRHSTRVERFEGRVRTHVFHCKIPAHKWDMFVRNAIEEQPGNWREKSAEAKTWQEYVKHANYSNWETQEIKEAFRMLDVYAQNHSERETLEHRESLGLIT